jgi:hypothetical protein
LHNATFQPVELSEGHTNKIVLGQLHIKNTIIVDSIMGGLFLSNTVTILDYETLYIQKNSDYALHIPEQNMKKLIFFHVKSNNNARLLEMFRRKTSSLANLKESSQVYKQEAVIFTTADDLDNQERVQGKIGGPWGKLSPNLPKKCILKRLGRKTLNVVTCSCINGKAGKSEVFTTLQNKN